MRVHTLAIYFATFAPALLATPCAQLFVDPQFANVNFLDPAAANGRWTIVDFTQCFIRAQNARDTTRGGRPGAHWEDARITRSSWDSTVQSVTDTVNNYFNGGSGQNDMLWLRGDSWSLAYWGMEIFKGCEMDAQRDLNTPHTAVSIILPGAASRLQTFGASPQNDDGSRNSEIERVAAHVFGLSGQTALTDYAWTNFSMLAQGVAKRFVSSVQNSAWALANSNDPNHCIVLDLRSLTKFGNSDGRDFPLGGNNKRKRSIANFPQPQA